MIEPRIGERQIRLHGLNENDEQIVLEAAGHVLGAGLIRGESAFKPTTRIWNPKAAAGLVAALERALAFGTESYLSNLRAELRDCPFDTVWLAAELQYLMFLASRDIKPTTKRDRVDAVLGLFSTPVEPGEMLVRAYDAGVFNVGIGFKVQGWKQLRGLYAFVKAWTEADGLPREVATYDPWAFKRFLGQTGATLAVRNLLLYLAYPDCFEPITSQKHKTDIRATFTTGLGIEPSDDVDRDLLEIRDRLEGDVGHRITFYSDDLMPRWRKRVAAKPVEVRSPVAPSTRRAWLVRGSSVRGQDLVPRWLAEKICSLPGTRLDDARPGMSREEIVRQVEIGYASDSYNERSTKVDEFYNFLSRMAADDVVATTHEEQMRLGRVTGPASMAPGQEGLDLLRPVDWSTSAAPVDLPDLPPSLLARLRVQQDVVDLTRDLPQLAPLLELTDAEDEQQVEDAEERAAAPRVVLPRVEPTLGQELHLPPDWLQKVVDVLRERRQLVLYGPPGTGKTHLALKLAAYLTRDPQNVTLVQFHPTYSYEDFFEGYRPVQGADGTVGFALRPGPFRRLVDRARNDLTRPYILIIDELNRANLATVFGELYFLLEYRNEAVELLYSSGEVGFTLPENVFIVGTMNTTDRSISLLDSAMRRRFGFVALHPDEEPIRQLLSSWLAHHRYPPRAARVLDALNARLSDRNLVVGPSYFMAAAVHDEEGDGLRRVWETAILPLLEEYHYGAMSRADVAQHYDLDGLLAEIERD